MATLDDIDIKKFVPLDINTPMVGQTFQPTPLYIAHQRQQLSKIVAQFGNNQAVITSYQQAIVDALSAGALKVDSVTATFDDILAGVQVSMEAISAPAGITARYEINVRVAGGTAHDVGMIFDLVDEGGGTYSGAVHINANKFTVGDGTDIGTIPFRIVGGVTYIKKAIIEDLSILGIKIGDDELSATIQTDISDWVHSTTFQDNGTWKTVFTDNVTLKKGRAIFIMSASLHANANDPSAWGVGQFRAYFENNVESKVIDVWYDEDGANLEKDGSALIMFEVDVASAGSKTVELEFIMVSGAGSWATVTNLAYAVFNAVK